MTDLDSYADELLRTKGVASLSQDERDQAKTDLMNEIDDEVNTMILDHLPEDARDGYEHLLDKDDEEELQSFLQTFIPDLDRRIDTVLSHFRRNYLG